MKAKKLLAIFSAFALTVGVVSLAACGGRPTTPPEPPEPPAPTDTYGLPVAAKGYYIKDADMIEDNGTRYLLYTTNETSGEQDNAIAIRKGTYEAGEGKGWLYGNQKIAVRGEDGEWDEIIGSASLVKGTFALSGTNYSWLMAYCATDKTNETQFSIGLAVADAPDGTWKKVSETPLIEFDASVYGTGSVGCYAPSLVNLDKGSVVRIFYTYADIYGHFAKFIDVNAADVGALYGENANSLISGEVQCPNNGEIYGGDAVTMFPNGDFAYDATEGKFYTVKDYSPAASLKPQVAEQIQLLWIAEAELYTAEEGDGWTDLRLWDNTDTPDAEYDRVYSGCIVSDAYGHVDGTAEFEIVYNVCRTEAQTADYLFTQNLMTFYGIDY